MISLDKEQIYLLELIKASLFGKTPEIPEDANWEKIFEAAKSQCIVPLLTSCVPTEYRDKWNSIAYQSKAHYMQMIYEQNALVKLLADDAIQFVILKGTAAAIYYPNPLLRSFGDIDIYVSEQNLDSVLNLIKENGYVYLSCDDRHYEFRKNGLDIELHSKFSCEYYRDIDHIILNGLNNAVEYKLYDCFFSGLPACENGLVLLGHIMQHLKGSGIGLRQIIDWMMFVHKELDDKTWEICFKSLVGEAGLEKFAKSITFMCIKWLGLPDNISWCDDADEDVSDQLLIYILDDGNLGQDRPLYEIIRDSMKAEGAYAFLQRVGTEKWPLAKNNFFRPFAWIYLFCRYICQGIKVLFTDRNLFYKHKHKMRREDLLKQLE